MTETRGPVKRATKKKPAPKKSATPKEPATMGRPMKLTPELQKSLIKVIKSGAPLKTALGYVGVTDETIYTWRNKAEAGKKVKWPSKELKAFIDFFVELDKAVHEANVKAQDYVTYLFTQPVDDLSDEQRSLAFRAATFQLTHRDGKNYSPRVQTEVTGEDGGPVQVSGRMAIELLRDLVANDADDA